MTFKPKYVIYPLLAAGAAMGIYFLGMRAESGLHNSQCKTQQTAAEQKSCKKNEPAEAYKHPLPEPHSEKSACNQQSNQHRDLDHRIEQASKYQPLDVKAEVSRNTLYLQNRIDGKVANSYDEQKGLGGHKKKTKNQVDIHQNNNLYFGAGSGNGAPPSVGTATPEKVKWAIDY